MARRTLELSDGVIALLLEAAPQHLPAVVNTLLHYYRVDSLRAVARAGVTGSCDVDAWPWTGLAGRTSAGHRDTLTLTDVLALYDDNLDGDDRMERLRARFRLVETFQQHACLQLPAPSASPARSLHWPGMLSAPAVDLLRAAGEDVVLALVPALMARGDYRSLRTISYCARNKRDFSTGFLQRLGQALLPWHAHPGHEEQAVVAPWKAGRYALAPADIQKRLVAHLDKRPTIDASELQTLLDAGADLLAYPHPVVPNPLGKLASHAIDDNRLDLLELALGHLSRQDPQRVPKAGPNQDLLRLTMESLLRMGTAKSARAEVMVELIARHYPAERSNLRESSKATAAALMEGNGLWHDSGRASVLAPLLARRLIDDDGMQRLWGSNGFSHGSTFWVQALAVQAGERPQDSTPVRALEAFLLAGCKLPSPAPESVLMFACQHGSVAFAQTLARMGADLVETAQAMDDEWRMDKCKDSAMPGFLHATMAREALATLLGKQRSASLSAPG